MSSHVAARPRFQAIVPAGGAGTRLWPLSRREQPKFLLDLLGQGRSLLQSTHERLAPLADAVCVVTGAQHAVAVARQLPGLAERNLFVEPSPRDSAAAIGLAAAVLARRDPDVVVGSFAADHVVRDDDAFARAVAEAVTTASTGLLVTVGITPTRPATGFGYIRSGGLLDIDGAPSAMRVLEFREKPDAEAAHRYLSDGGYRWNAGMFVARARTLMELFGTYQPDLAAGLQQVAAAWDGPSRQQALDEVWPRLPKIAIDYAIAEPAAAAGRVAVVPGSFGWDDVGDFGSLASILPHRDDGTQVVGACDVLVERAGAVLVASSTGRLVAVLGLHDVVVVDTPDALLVAHRDDAQDVRALVEQLRDRGRSDLL